MELSPLYESRLLSSFKESNDKAKNSNGKARLSSPTPQLSSPLQACLGKPLNWGKATGGATHPSWIPDSWLLRSGAFGPWTFPAGNRWLVARRQGRVL